MEGLYQDLRYAVRSMLQAPAFTLATVLTLMLGIIPFASPLNWVGTSCVIGSSPAERAWCRTASSG